MQCAEPQAVGAGKCTWIRHSRGCYLNSVALWNHVESCGCKWTVNHEEVTCFTMHAFRV